VFTLFNKYLFLKDILLGKIFDKIGQKDEFYFYFENKLFIKSQQRRHVGQNVKHLNKCHSEIQRKRYLALDSYH
jgi:hypothetical protein